MSRRDTIIIAVLVNAALLMILFATAMRTDHSKEDTKKESKLGNIKMAELSQRFPEQAPNHEVVLNEFIHSVPTLAEGGQENIFSFEEVALGFPTKAPIPVVEAPHISSVAEDEYKPTQLNLEDQFVNVTVKKGDFLEKIAKANNTTVAAIMKANNMLSTQLKVGQVLRVPLVDNKKPMISSPPRSLESEYYIVKEGDNPWLISTRNKIHLEELLRLNGLDEQKARRLRPGDKLRIR